MGAADAIFINKRNPEDLGKGAQIARLVLRLERVTTTDATQQRHCHA